jgi:DNA-binding NarL/FixJ family response regulator
LAGEAQGQPDSSIQPLRLAVMSPNENEWAVVQQMVQMQARGWEFATYCTPDEALKGMSLAPPDVLLLDISILGHSGIDWTRKIKSNFPSVAILIIAASADAEMVLWSLMAGARGYLLKPVLPTQLVTAVTEAAQGRAALCAQAQTILLDSLQRAAKSAEAKCLTQRECQVAVCLVQYFTDKEIGKALSIATGTVHVHLASVFKKLHAHSRKDAATKFLALG